MHARNKPLLTTVLAAAAMLFALSYSQPSFGAKKDTYTKTLIGIGAALLLSVGLGVGLAIGSKVAADKADERADELHAKGYAAACQAEPATCQDIADGLQTRDELATGAMVSFIVGGAVILGATSYAIKERPGGSSARGQSDPLSNGVNVALDSGPRVGIVVRW